MKPALRHLLVCALLLIAGLGAQAQGDEVLERYGLSLVNLSESVRLLDSDVAASRDELDSAAGALRFLAAEAGNPGLVAALERVFERARLAISNRSSTDLAVQNALIRGGFQRAVFESARTLMVSEPAAARARLERLSADLGFDEETSASLAETGSAEGARRIFDAAIAEGVVRKLQSAQAAYAENQEGAYRTLASAYGDFLIIQDSPRAQMRLNEQFGVAAVSLVENRTEELNSAIGSLGQGFRQLAEAARAAPQESGAEQAVENSPQPANEAAVAQQTAGDEGASTAQAQEGQQSGTEVAEMPAVSLGQVQANQAAPAEAGAASAAPTNEQASGEQATSDQNAQPGGDAPAQTAASEDAQRAAASDATAAENEASEGAARLQALRVELIANGVPAARAVEVATRLSTRNVTTLDEAVDGLYAQAGRVVAAAQSGEVAAAQGALDGFATSYELQLQPALELISPAVHERVEDLIGSLAAVPALRAQDALVLLGQVEAIDDLLAGEPSSNVQIMNTEATILWAGWVRIATLIVLMLLAIVPLYLLNLAFGGGNRNWQLIGVALFLLLLPAVYEGLASIGAVAAKYSGIEVLAILLSFSMFQNPIAQIVWAAITVAAILFAVAGLYGICVQFGLLGSRRATVSDSHTVRSTAVVPDADTVVDWDEEF